MSGDLVAALAAWRVALGADAVSVAPAELAAANLATLAASASIVAIITPSVRDQVPSCLEIAALFQVPLHAVSRGCNWGYGSRLPMRGRAVLLSLARLDRVLALDEAMGTVRIEPGVTFGQLLRHLTAAGSGLLAPKTGSGPGTSVVGNVLERGIGKGLYEDMAGHALDFEVVLPSGAVVRTAAGSGPAVGGLFVQGNLGVVTAMSFRLHRAPALRQMVWGWMSDAALGACIDGLRPVLQRGDPWFLAEVVSGHRAGTQGSAGGEGWIVAITVWGDGAEALGCRRGRAWDLLAGAGGTGLGASAAEAGGAVDEDWLRGEGLRGAYSAKAGGMPADPDPDRDGCGVVWIAPSLPMRGAGVVAAVERIGALLQAHGFGPAISLRRMDGRTLQAVVGLFYDRDEAGGDARAVACSGAVHAWMRGTGLAPYRLGVLEGAAAWAGDAGRAGLLRGIKRLVDPGGILAPGRYIEGEDGA